MQGISPFSSYVLLAMVVLFSFSALCARRFDAALKDVMNYGTAGTSASKAARLYLRERRVSVKVRRDEKALANRFDMRERTLWLSPLSDGTTSLWCYCDALRQAAVAERFLQRPISSSLGQALVMLTRILGPLAVVNAIVALALENDAFMVAAAIVMAAYVVVTAAHALHEHGITRSVTYFGREHDLLGNDEQEAASAFYRAVELSEFASAWSGTRALALVIPQSIRDSTRRKNGPLRGDATAEKTHLDPAGRGV